MTATPITIGTSEAKTKFFEVVRNLQKGITYQEIKEMKEYGRM